MNKYRTEAGTTVELAGTIEESVSFEHLIGEIHGPLQVNCKGITRINSVGVKTWMRYFQSLKSQKKAFKFIDCAYPIVEQLNIITNFACGGEVTSILLPFSCTLCQKEFVATCLTAELKANGLQIPSVRCDENKCAAEFDDDPDEYLSFLD